MIARLASATSCRAEQPRSFNALPLQAGRSCRLKQVANKEMISAGTGTPSRRRMNDAGSALAASHRHRDSIGATANARPIAPFSLRAIVGVAK
jgi:hypothetical protein